MNLTGVHPTSVVEADLNRDGNLDLIVTNAGSNSVSVLLGNGNGFFKPAVNYPTGTTPTSVAVGDFARNGKLDLAVTVEGSNGVDVLLGNGDGTFQPAVLYPTGYGPTTVAVADLNGDGLPDLITANRIGQSFSVLLGQGGGTFKAAQTFPSARGLTTLAVKDLNGDGKPDLVAGYYSNVSHLGSFSILLGNGDGTFLPAASKSFGTGLIPTSLAVADLNGDGKPDIVAAITTKTGGGEVEVGLQSAGNFILMPFATDKAASSVAVADVNQDGRLDLVTTNAGGNSVSVLYGNGNGTFTPAVNFGVGTKPVAVAVADVSGDGVPDLAVANYGDGNVGVLVNTDPVSGTGNFQAPQGNSARTQTYDVVSADLNGDGIQDLVTVNRANNVLSVLLGNGDGTFKPAVNLNAGTDPRAVVVGDFTGDGKLDLVVADYGSGGTGNALFFQGNGDGTFRNSALISNLGVDPLSVVAADMNGDGKLDLVFGGVTPNGVSVMLGNGDGTFKSPTFLASANTVYSVAVGDLNGDGKLDIVAADQGPLSKPDKTLSVFLASGTGFSAAVNYTTDLAPRAVALADLNHDGILDIVSANAVGNDVSVLLGNGNGTFRAAQNYATGTGSTSVTVADLTGNGAPELVVANATGNSLSVLLNNGNGTFTPAPTVPTGPNTFPRNTVVADFNRDGVPDLAVAEPGASTVAVALGLPNSAKSFQISPSSGTVTAGGSFTATVTALVANMIQTDVNYNGTVVFTSSDPQFTPPAPYTYMVADQGVHTFTLTLKTAGQQTITVSDAQTGTVIGTFTFTVQAGVASQLVFLQQPTTTQAGMPINPPVVVRVTDAYGNLIKTDNSMVTLAIGNNPGGSTLGGTTSVMANMGVAVFSNLTLNKADPGYTLVASDGSLTPATSKAFTVVPGAVTQLSYSQEPVNTIAGQVFTVTVQVLDQFGNVVSTDSSTVTVALGANPGGSTLGGTLMESAVNGVATFADLTLNKVGNGYTLVASDGSLTPATSTPFNIAANAASVFAVTGFPSTVTAGIAQGFTLTVQDAYGNTVPTYQGTVTFASSDPKASLPHPYPFTSADNGSHAFMATLATSGPQSLTFTGTGGVSGMVSFTVVSASATHLGISAPASAYAGFAFTVVVNALDAFGNVATNYTGTVHFTSTDGSAVLPADYTFVAADMGSHTFFNQVTLKSVGAQTLTVRDVSNSSVTATSGPIAVTFASDNAVWLSGLYHDLLGRSLDSVGANFFEPPLEAARGAALNLTASQILASAEFRTDLVLGYFNTYLKRQPSSAELNLFVGQLATMTDEQVIAQIVGSTEYFNNHGGTNLSWLQAVYQDILGRPLDQAGQNYYLPQLTAGASLASVALQILGSAEYQTILINADYAKYLQHAAPPGGVNFYLAQFQAGKTNEQVIALFTSSTEYLQLHGNTNNTWLAAIYPDLLNRPLDTAGSNYFGNVLFNGYAAQRQATITNLQYSQEYETHLINTYYLKYLGRQVQLFEMNNFWLNQFTIGRTYEQIQAQILASDEYYAISGGTNLSWLQNVYQEVLGRPLDQAGQNYYLGQVFSGASRQAVALQIFASQEYLNILIASTFQTFLRRQPSTQEASFWLNQLEGGLATSVFVNQLLQSNEYFSDPHTFP